MKQTICRGVALAAALVLLTALFVPAAQAAAPNAPRSVAVSSLTHDTVYLAITEPAGGEKPFAYVLNPINPTGSAKTIAYADRITYVSMTDLAPGTDYTVQIAARDRAGNESAATRVRFTTPQASSLPETPKVTATAGDGSVTLAMKKGELNGQRFFEYIIELRGGGKTISTKSRRDAHTVTGLSNGTLYAISVRVRTTGDEDTLSPAVTVWVTPSAAGGNAYAVIAKPSAYKGGDARFTVNAPAADLDGVELDGAPLSAGQFAAAVDPASGNATITIKADALAGLQNGQHAVVFRFASGTASTSLSVGTAAAAPSVAAPSAAPGKVSNGLTAAR